MASSVPPADAVVIEERWYDKTEGLLHGKHDARSPCQPPRNFATKCNFASYLKAKGTDEARRRCENCEGIHGFKNTTYCTKAGSRNTRQQG